MFLEHSSTCLFAFFPSGLATRQANPNATDPSVLISDRRMVHQVWLAGGGGKAAGREEDEGEAGTIISMSA